MGGIQQEDRDGIVTGLNAKAAVSRMDPREFWFGLMELLEPPEAASAAWFGTRLHRLQQYVNAQPPKWHAATDAVSLRKTRRPGSARVVRSRVGGEASQARC